MPNQVVKVVTIIRNRVVKDNVHNFFVFLESDQNNEVRYFYVMTCQAVRYGIITCNYEL